MKTRPLALGLLLTLTSPLVLPPRAGLAQSADDATTKMARQRFQEGVGYYDKGNYELARAAFLQAYALRKHPTVLLNLAQSSLKSGHALEAARYFQQFLRDHNSAATDAQRGDAIRGLNEARAKLGRIDVTGVAIGTEIFLDDERVGVAPLDHSIDAEPGTHTVRAHGVTDQAVQVTVSAGQSATARLGGSAPAAPAPVPTPTPGPPPAEEPPPTPAEPTPPAPSETTPEATAPFPPPVQEEPYHRGRWGWVVFGGTVFVASVGTAIVMALEKQSAQNAADTAASDIVANGGGVGTCARPTAFFASACAALATDNSNVNTDATIANIAGGVAIASGAFTVLYAIFGTKVRSDSASLHPVVTPMMGKGVGGLTLGGAF